MLDLFFALAALSLVIFVLYLLWSMTQSLKGIDASLQAMAGQPTEEE